ncbi:MAG: hypothetical protein ACKVI4_15270, partial [Actinomycetales bacterium]
MPHATPTPHAVSPPRHARCCCAQRDAPSRGLRTRPRCPLDDAAPLPPAPSSDAFDGDGAGSTAL